MLPVRIRVHSRPARVAYREPHAIVGVDDVTRVLGFGVAKASGWLQSTQNDELKGKLAYMSPQQIMGEPVDRRADVWSAAVCLWESLAGARLFKAEVQATVAVKVLNDAVEPPSKYRPEIPKSLDDVLMKGLAREPDERYATARDMAIAIEEACTPATARAVGEWVSELAAEALGSRATRIEEIESAVEPNPSLGKLLAAVPLDTPSSRSLVTSPEVAASSETSSSATAARLGLARDEAPTPAASKSRSSVIVAAALVSVALAAGALIVSRPAKAMCPPLRLIFCAGQSSVITSGQLAVTLYQTDPVSDKIQPRMLRAGIYTEAEELISDSHDLTFDLTSDNPRKRELQVRFVLTRKADEANGQEVVLRLEEKHAGTSHYKEYKSLRYLMRRSFTSDFDF